MVINKHFYLVLVIFLLSSISGSYCISCNTPKEGEPINLSVIIEMGKYFATNVSINGNPVEGKFLIDTGSETLVTGEVARQAGITGRKEEEISDGYENASVKIGKADFSIDGFYFNRVRVNIIEDHDIGLGVFDKVVGIIGHDLMENCSWRFTDESVAIIPDIKRRDDHPGFVSTKLELQARSIPYVVVSYGKPRFTCLLDTGDDGFLEVTELIKNHVPEGKIRRGRGSAVTMLLSNQKADDASVYEVIKTDSMEIAGCVIKDPVAYVTSNEEGASLGSQLFDYFEVIVDFPNKRLWLKPLNDIYASEEWEIFGFSIDVKKDGVYVDFVWEDSPAWGVGLRPGVQLKSINESDFRNIEGIPSSAIFSEFWEARKKDKMKITFVYEGQLSTRVLDKRQLF